MTPTQYIIMWIGPLGLGVVYGLRPAKVFTIRLFGAMTLYSAVWVLLAARGPIFASAGHVMGAIVGSVYLLMVNFAAAIQGWVIGLVAHFCAFALRRFLRLRRGLCPKCAYPMGESAVCSECGEELLTRPAAT